MGFNSSARVPFSLISVMILILSVYSLSLRMNDSALSNELYDLDNIETNIEMELKCQSFFIAREVINSEKENISSLSNLNRLYRDKLQSYFQSLSKIREKLMINITNFDIAIGLEDVIIHSGSVLNIKKNISGIARFFIKGNIVLEYSYDGKLFKVCRIKISRTIDIEVKNSHLLYLYILNDDKKQFKYSNNTKYYKTTIKITGVEIYADKDYNDDEIELRVYSNHFYAPKKIALRNFQLKSFIPLNITVFHSYLITSTGILVEVIEDDFIFDDSLGYIIFYTKFSNESFNYITSGGEAKVWFESFVEEYKPLPPTSWDKHGAAKNIKNRNGYDDAIEQVYFVERSKDVETHKQAADIVYRFFANILNFGNEWLGLLHPKHGTYRQLIDHFLDYWGSKWYNGHWHQIHVLIWDYEDTVLWENRSYWTVYVSAHYEPDDINFFVHLGIIKVADCPYCKGKGDCGSVKGEEIVLNRALKRVGDIFSIKFTISHITSLRFIKKEFQVEGVFPKAFEMDGRNIDGIFIRGME